MKWILWVEREVEKRAKLNDVLRHNFLDKWTVRIWYHQYLLALRYKLDDSQSAVSVLATTNMPW